MALIKKLKARFSRKVLFSILALVMIVFMGAFIIYAIDFLATTLNAALSAGGRGTPIERFDIKGFEALKLRRP